MQSWGGLPDTPQQAQFAHWPEDVAEGITEAGLACGAGRSYGDCGLSANGKLLNMRCLNRFIQFDSETGVLECEAGVTLGDILQLVVPRGWILPVLPGTRHVTVGGAIANDVHGKNHHRRGTFGCHVLEINLVRSTGETVCCSPEVRPEWFRATVAGLGLTGVILSAKLQLLPLSGSRLHAETIRFESLAEFFVLADESERDHEYTVAWVDCLAQGQKLGRGHFIRANHARGSVNYATSTSRLSVPFYPPISPVNRWTLKLFNSLYFQRQQAVRKQAEVTLDSYFFPLDGIENWNRLYGKSGFRQFQCVVPLAGAEDSIGQLLQQTAQAGEGSLLAVLKTFGEVESPGILSFPRHGATLALDFPWRGQKTLDLLQALEATVLAVGGALYPAKDAHMSKVGFDLAYPGVKEFQQFRDPGLCSLMAERLMSGTTQSEEGL